MNKLFMFLFFVILFFGIAGCPASDDPSSNTVTSSIVTQLDDGSYTASGDTLAGNGINDGKFSAVPEPATLLLLGAGMVGVAVFGRKRYKK
jgi:hypothetical protein